MTQREYQNENAKRRREKMAAFGLCRCGAKALNGMMSCASCCAKSRELARNKYRTEKGIPLDAPIDKRGAKPRYKVKGRYKKGSRVNMMCRVRRSILKDGYGREDVYWVAQATLDGKNHLKKFSVNKYGEDSSKMLATLQRMMWLIKSGAWNPDDGGVMERGSYMELFSGNPMYEDCEITERESPYLFS